MPHLSAFTRYASSLIGATLLTSFAFRNILHERTSTAERDRLTAHKTILESLVARLKSGEDVSQGEIGRLLRLARGVESDGGEVQDRDVSWREVVFGRRVTEDEALENARREWDAAVAQDLSGSSPKVQSPVAPSTPIIHVVNSQPKASPKRPTFL